MCLFDFLIGTLPSPKETIKGNIKTITDYKIDEDDGKKYKVLIIHLIKVYVVFD